MKRLHLVRYFFYRKSISKQKYVFLLFSPVNRQILDAKSFIKIRDCFRDSVDDMGYFVTDDKLNVLSGEKDTLAAN